jgi:sensor histidine kinase YesM
MTNNLTKDIGRPQIHFIVWGLFITWEVVFVGLFFGEFGHPISYISHYSIILFLFYLHALILLPWALINNNQALWRVPVIILLETCGFILLSFIVDKWLIELGFLKKAGTLTLNLQYVMKSLYRELYFLGCSTGYYYLVTFLKEKRKTEDLEKRHVAHIFEKQKAEEEIMKAQNAFLLSQINPHFFFNTLDYLYHNVLDSAPESAEAISILATMMRFAIDADKVGSFIKLGDEIEQVENLIYLNQLREQLAIKFQVDEDAREVRLIPLVLLTLAENIFKHGSLKNHREGAVIRIWIAGASLNIETENVIQVHGNLSRSGNGLKNIDSRLKHAYGKNVYFNYGTDHANRFKVSLKIPLSKTSPFASFSYPSANIDII